MSLASLLALACSEEAFTDEADGVADGGSSGRAEPGDGGHAGSGDPSDPTAEGGAPAEGQGGVGDGAGAQAGAPSSLDGGAPTTSSSGSAGRGGGAGSGQGGTAGSTPVAGSGGSAGLGGSAGSPAQRIKASDDFVVSAQGWTVSGDTAGSAPVHSPTGGRPDGSISFTDGGDGIWFFTAPSKYLGDISNLYGGELRFDLIVTAITEPFAYPDVQLTSDAVTLIYDCAVDPNTTWSTYKVPLTEAGWKVGSLTGAVATASQFKQVLAKLTRLRIRGEFNTGADTARLDNVYLGVK